VAEADSLGRGSSYGGPRGFGRTNPEEAWHKTHGKLLKHVFFRRCFKLIKRMV
jgi:hypothetical protein